jgi:hypothetical protein
MESEPPRLRRSEIIVGVSAGALLAVAFLLGWYRSAGVTHDAWNALSVLRWLILVTVAAGLALPALQATRRSPGLPVTVSMIVTVLGAVTAVLLIVRLLSTGASPRLGAYLGLVATIGILCGGFRSLRTEQGWTPGDAHPVETVALTSAGPR